MSVKKSDDVNLSRRAFLGSSVGASLGLFCLPRTLFAALETRADADGSDVALRFAAMSDVHFNGDPDAPEPKRLTEALEFMYKYSAAQTYPKFDALVVAGDVSNHGYEKEIALFKKTLDAGIKEGTRTILCMGNHEFYGGNKSLWEKTFGVAANRRYEANGFQFIALSPEKGTCKNGDYLYALDWFEKELEAAEAADPDPNKPIFVLQHYHITPTVYGSRGDDNWGIDDLFETLQKHPRVVDFSGHSHYPINDPRSAWQGGFSAFGTGTLSYFEMGGEGGRYSKFPEGYRNAAQTYVVEVRRDNSVALKPFDIITGEFFDVVYLIAKPGDVERFLYTDERCQTSEKPSWSADATAALVGETFSNGAKIEFPQATCRDVVHSYRVDVEKRDASGAWKSFGSEYFWSEYYFRNPPKTTTVELELDEGSEYRVKIVALNPFFKESERKLELSFSTPNDSIDKTAPAPDANVLDVSFVDGNAVNKPVNELETQKTVASFGSPEIDADSAFFDGVDDYCKIDFDNRDYAKLRRATLAATFQIDEFPNGCSDVFANTEGSGVAFEVNGKEKRLEFWASIDGTYQIVAAPLETGRAVDAFGTFDGNALVLYVDGKEVARKEIAGKLSHPKAPLAQAFCVGSDIATGGVGGSFFKGRVWRARLFSWALSAEQVENLFQKKNAR